MEFIEKWGTDVETAVNLALDDLKTTRDQVDVTVLEEPSRGFFGIGSKLALVRVSLKEDQKIEEKKQSDDNTNKKVDVKPAKEREIKTGKKSEKKKKKDVDFPKHTAKEETESVGSTIDSLKQKEEFLEENVAVPFLKDVAEKMGLSLEFKAYKTDEYILIDISGKDTGSIIGKRGQTLDAIQYLTNLVLNKESGHHQKVILDAENYRSKREKTLQQLAEKLAAKAVKTRRSQRLEPMNPYERKVIHTALQTNPRVKTKSEGQDPYRRVIIELK